MAKKRLSGKQWFEELGRSHESLGIYYLVNDKTNNWTLWARKAYCIGRINQCEYKKPLFEVINN
jgi:hypothetical protein